MKKTCGNCRWWDQEAHEGRSEKRGLCRVRPPQQEPTRGDGYWPHTHRNDWCGAHREDFEATKARVQTAEDAGV